MKLPALLSFCVIIAGSAFASPSQDSSSTSMKESARRRSGGIILDTRKQSGSVTFAYASNAVNSNFVLSAAKSIETAFKIKTLVKALDSVSADRARSILAESGSNAAVIIGNGGPDFIVAPDECWSYVNASSLNDGNASKRIERQICRAFAYACGAGSSTKETIMSRIEKPSDLERFSDARFTLATTENIINFMDQIGIKPAKKALYIRACREGWAPPPTDEYQRAVWSKVKKENPLPSGFPVEP